MESSSLPGRAIEIEQSERPASGFVSRQTHAGNVHVVRSKDRADPPDDSRDVVILEKQNHSTGRRLDGIAVDADNPRFVPCAKKSASNGDLRIPTPDRDMQPFVEIGLFGGFDLLDSDAAGGGHGAHVDAIDFLAASVLKETGEN